MMTMRKSLKRKHLHPGKRVLKPQQLLKRQLNQQPKLRLHQLLKLKLNQQPKLRLLLKMTMRKMTLKKKWIQPQLLQRQRKLAW